MTITIDLPVKNEVEKEILEKYLKVQGELFLKYFSMPEYTLNSNIEKEILSSSEDDYVEIENTESLLKIIS